MSLARSGPYAFTRNRFNLGSFVLGLAYDRLGTLGNGNPFAPYPWHLFR